MPTSDKCVVLVTGGSGFLGQHVVGLLQTRAPHVTEIRVLDLPSNPYVNNLDYEASKPVKEFLGSINDPELIRKACQGVHCVMHIASLIDVSMFPNMDKLESVNVQGTSLLLNICKEFGVERFIYCSSISVVCGQNEIINGTESTTPIPEVFFFDGYASTKRKAESMVLAANCEAFRTLSIRPTTIYGEQDNFFLAEPLRMARKLGRWSPVDCRETVHHLTYVGNMAWAFICADKALMRNEKDAMEDSSKEACLTPQFAQSTGGKAFFITDDTPLTNIFEFQSIFVSACGFATDVIKIPASVMLVAWYIFYALLWIISIIVKVNFYGGLPSVRFFRKTFTFKSDLAKDLLGYAPIYSYEESKERTMNYCTKQYGK